jgi:NADP-dependent 3-hydroxy acid dehydrogenase YdfG
MALRGGQAFVTGASSGLGQCIAERLAAEGMNVGILGRDPKRLEAVAARCRTFGVKVHAVPGDLADAQYIAKAYESVTSALGPIDVVVNNAAISQTQRLRVGDVPLDLWDEMQQTNVRGTFVLCNIAVTDMKKRGRGAIVNIGSTAAHVVLPGVGPYAASKFAVRALTDAIAQECDGTGVRVCLVSSGPINTPFWDRRPSPPPMERDAMVQPDDVFDAILWLITRPKNVRCDEILLRPARTSPLEV